MMNAEYIWTDAEGLHRMAWSPLAERYAPEGALLVAPEDLPSCHYAEAWRLVDGAVVIDIDAARFVRRAQIMAERDRQISAASSAVNIAADDGDAVAEASARAWRKALRDLNPDADLAAADSAEELDQVWPACLNGPAN